MEANNTNYILIIIILAASIYYFYIQALYTAFGWLLLAISIVAGIYLTKIGAEKKYYYMIMLLPVISLLLFVYDFFY
ncbi:hypothetical protein [Methanobacterium alcaliphilum]|uniref:hypothetical protein n=1 Tax=Methanobacterium alcaliphilum TaxID=392018 RepID=UPI00200AD298|nr:hypothetical protein [Methanobacterium alcaliphilum]MCK9151579.1 hypothetical protein [Methanobacterium alcaliphilum]